MARSTAISMLDRMLIPLMSCILTPLLARILLEARIAIPLGICMLSKFGRLRIALTTTEFRICAFPVRRATATATLSGASRLCDTLMLPEKAHQSE
jgi:hypothetical protein